MQQALIRLWPAVALALAACGGGSGGSGSGGDAISGGADGGSRQAARPAVCDNMLDEPYTTRTALVDDGRPADGELMLRFVQFTDAHIIDDDGQALIGFSPVDPVLPMFEAAMRLQEEYSDEVLNSMVTGINDCNETYPSAFALVTGDSADITTVGEVRRYIDNLDGGFDRIGAFETQCVMQLPEGASDRKIQRRCTRFTGRGLADTQTPDRNLDSFLTKLPLTRTIEQLAATTRAALAGGTATRTPGMPELLRCQSGTSGCPNEALAVPYYVAFGNHDGYVRGTVALDLGANLAAGLVPGRHFMIEQHEFIDEFFFTAEQPGPVGHGFHLADEARRNDDDPRNDGYYAFDAGDGRFRMIVLNTILDGSDPRIPTDEIRNPFGLADGTIDAEQFRWLQDELAAAYDNEQLVVLLSHHPDLSFADLGPAAPLLPIEVTAAELDAELASWPNLIAWIAGHTHRHRIRAFTVDGGTGGNGTVEVEVDCKVPDACHGFWQIESSSLIDDPQQQRLIEIFDNGDGTGTIRGSVLTHSFERAKTLAAFDDRCQFYPTEPDKVEAALTDADLGALCTEGGTRSGQPDDRNVELIFPMPSFAGRP